MEVARITIKGEDIRKIAKLLAKKEDIYYQHETKDVVILLDEEYYSRIESNLMSVNILHFKDEGTVEIEMIAGGGNHGYSSWGAETKELTKITRSIIEICNENAWEIVEIYPEGFKESLEKTGIDKVVDSIKTWFK